MFYETTPAGYLLRIRVTPNAVRCGVTGIFKDSTGIDYLKIGLNAVPEKGKANQELIKFLSKLLKLSKSSFSITSGETDRYKKILLAVSQNTELENLLIHLEEKYDS